MAQTGSGHEALRTIPNLGILLNATGNHAPGLVERPEKFSAVWDNGGIILSRQEIFPPR